MSATFEHVPVDRITPHDRNVRRDLGDLTELAASIKAQGLLQPLIVAPDGDGYVLIAGHRRHAAAVKAKVASLPCVVRADLDTPAKVLECMLVENLQRADLTVMEEADAYQQLELLGVKEAAIAKATGRSRATVHQRLLLASLPTERREQYESGSLSLDGAVQCAKLRERWADDAEILDMIDQAGTWSFGGSYGVQSRIERLLEERKRASEPEPEVDDEPDDDALDLDGRRSEWEIRRQQELERNEAITPLVGLPQAWLERSLEQDGATLGRLVDWALSDCVYEFDVDHALPFVGIDPPGEDEDTDDANDRIAASLRALPYWQKVVVLSLVITGASQAVGAWAWQRQTQAFVDELGYEPTSEERALLVQK